MKRRSIISLSGGVLAAVSGCHSPLTGGGPSPTATSTDTRARQTQSPIPPDAVAFAGEVVQQASDERSPRIKLTFTNVSDTSIDVVFNYVVPFSQLIAKSERGQVELIPDIQHEELHSEGYDAPIAPDEQRNGCWKLPEWVLWVASVTQKTLQPDQTVSEEYSVYNGPESESCFPEADFRFRDELHSFTLAFTLSIDSEGHIAVKSPEVVDRE